MKLAQMNPIIIKFFNHSTLKEIQEKIRNKNYLLFRQESIGALIKETGRVKIPSQIFRRWMYYFNSPNRKFMNWKKLTKEEKEIIKKRLLSLPKKFV